MLRGHTGRWNIIIWRIVHRAMSARKIGYVRVKSSECTNAHSKRWAQEKANYSHFVYVVNLSRRIAVRANNTCDMIYPAAGTVRFRSPTSRDLSFYGCSISELSIKKERKRVVTRPRELADGNSY